MAYSPFESERQERILTPNLSLGVPLIGEKAKGSVLQGRAKPFRIQLALGLGA